MLIGGLQKLSLIDYPRHIAAIIFTQGCNFRCHFCNNPKLVVPASRHQNIAGSALRHQNSERRQKDYSLISEDSLFGFLKIRAGKLDAVVITGGEPTLHHDLADFIKKIKAMGYLIKLDTNGTAPAELKNLIEQSLIDYIAMDIKGPLEKYEQIIGVKGFLPEIKKSIKIIKESGLEYEFRSTIMPAFHNREDIIKMGELIEGATQWYLQKFKPLPDLVDKDFSKEKSFTDKQMEELCDIGRQYARNCEVR